MNTFDGVIEGHSLISIDSFLESKGNFKSTIYFLSHCHTDHMHGLHTKKFFELLTNRKFSKIYLSDVSRKLLRNDPKYEHLSPYLRALPVEKRMRIKIYNQDGEQDSKIIVRLIPVDHCLGSVMFSITAGEENILYTGDFRLLVGSAAQMKYLHEKISGKPLKFKRLYIDTTFCSSNYLYFPSLKDSIEKIVSLVEDWLEDPNHIVCILCRYALAYESIFKELYEKCGFKTYMKEERISKYKGIEGIEEILTSDASERRILASFQVKMNIFENITNPDIPQGNILNIMPTARYFKFTTDDFSGMSRSDEKFKAVRVCFSTHSSLAEIRDFVNYLKPEQLYPIVTEKDQSKEQMLELIYESKETENEDISLSKQFESLNVEIPGSKY